MSVLSKPVLSSSHGVKYVASAAVSIFGLLYAVRRLRKQSSGSSGVALNEKNRNNRSATISTGRSFYSNLLRIMRILIPSLHCEEIGYMLLVAVSLLLRTYADVWMISNGTSIESGFTFYKMTNLDNRIANADHLLTQDVEKFCDCLVELYSNISKPILDMCLYIVKLSKSIGFQGPGWMLLYLLASGAFLTRLRKPLGRMTVKEQQLEGEFRHINSRLITNSEEIAFYQGQLREKESITKAFLKLFVHLKSMIAFRFTMGCIDNVTTKYIATLVGYAVVSRPFLNLANPAYVNAKPNDLLELCVYDLHGVLKDYYKSGRMLVKLAEAIGRIALAGRELARLSGYTARVTQLCDVLADVNSGCYLRSMVSQVPQSTLNNNTLPVPLQPVASLKPGHGLIIIKDNVIRFDKVPLVTPNGDVLIPQLSFTVESGVNVLVAGPNGAGKSSLFRILGELWPLFGGTLTKPVRGKLFYVPQRPYMTIGTLRDQVIYPHNETTMLANGIRDQDLEQLLGLVQLSYILEREGGWNAVNDWMDVLSGGEKQRIAMSRLIYHRPQFAILDECTSAVSVDVEGHIYEYCKSIGVTLFTVSHRKSLWRYHEFCLELDGRGNYSFKPIDSSTTPFGS